MAGEEHKLLTGFFRGESGMEEQRRGSCLCGKIRYTVIGPVRPVIYCHCSQCRKQTGHVVAATDVDDRFVEIQGAQNLTWFAASASAKRGFCSRCGSLLFWKSNGSERTSIMAGGFDEPSNLEATSHIFCDDKGSYYELKDGLPQFPGSGE